MSVARAWHPSELLVGGRGARQSTAIRVRCSDGRVRVADSRSRTGWRRSGSTRTQRLWWHDLVEWERVGLGPATWDWSQRSRCSYVAPDGRGCALPCGHSGYLRLSHRTSQRRRFVVRMRGEWPGRAAVAA